MWTLEEVCDYHGHWDQLRDTLIQVFGGRNCRRRVVYHFGPTTEVLIS